MVPFILCLETKLYYLCSVLGGVNIKTLKLCSEEAPTQKTAASLGFNTVYTATPPSSAQIYMCSVF